MAKSAVLINIYNEDGGPAQLANSAPSVLPDCDFAAFLAVVQSLRVPLLDFEPKISQTTERKGHGTYIIKLSNGNGLALKTASIVDGSSADDARKRLLSEILILRHPLLRFHPNLLRLRGIAWEFQSPPGSNGHAMPMLISEECQLGNLKNLMLPAAGCRDRVPFIQRVSLCCQIGRAIDAMHKLNVAHGDIKHENVLVVIAEDEVIAKVIDFDCSQFGAETTTLTTGGYTFPWTAPEAYLSQTFQTKEGAKSADAFSYGRLCAWLLFYPEVDAGSEDLVSARSFDFDTAMESLVIEESFGALANTLFVRRMTPTLRDFFRTSYCNEVNDRASFASLSSQLNSVLSIWYIHHETNSKLKWKYFTSQLSMTYLQAKHQSRNLLSKLVNIWPRRGKSELSISNNLQVTFIWVRLLETILFLVIGAGSLSVPVIVYLLWDRSKNASQAYKDGGYIYATMAPFLLFIVLYFVWRDRSHYRIWRSWVPFGRLGHLVPELPELFPLLNRLHYKMREAVVMDLLKRAESDCQGCRSRAAYQLALCRHTTFGKFDDDSPGEAYWLQQSGKKNVKRLCAEVNFWEDRYEVSWRRMKDFFDVGRPRPDDWLYGSADYLSFESLPEAISRYKEEIEGKKKACITSALILLDALGELCMEHMVSAEAEAAFRERRELEDLIQSHGLFRRKIHFRTSFDHRYSSYNICRALAEQGRWAENIDELKFLLNKSDILTQRWWRKFPGRSKTIEWDDIFVQAQLTRLLVKQGRLEEAIKVQLIQTLLSKRNDTVVLLTDRDSIESCLDAVLFLAIAMAKNHQIAEAIEILQHRVDVHNTLLGPSDTRTWTLRKDLAGMLLFGSADQVIEALGIQNILQAQEVHTKESPEMISLMTDRSLALSTSGNIPNAMIILDEVLAIKRKVFGDAHLVSLGSMCELSGSLCLQSKEDLERPAEMQRDLLALCKTLTHALEIQEQIIKVIWVLATPGYHNEVLVEMRRLQELFELRFGGHRDAVLKINGYVVFILLHMGSTYENVDLLDEVFGLAMDLERSTVDFLGSQPSLSSFRASQLIASVFSKKTRLLSVLHGFGVSDLPTFEESIKYHRLTVKRASLVTGMPELVINSKTQLAIELSKIGFLLGQRMYISEAYSTFEEVLASKEVHSTPQATYYLSELRFRDATGIGIKEQQHLLALENFRQSLFEDPTGLAPLHPGDASLFINMSLYIDPGMGPPQIRGRRFILLECAHYIMELHITWSLDPQLHPDFLRSIGACADWAYYHKAKNYGLRIYRQINLGAPLVFTERSQRPTIMLYKIGFASLLSSYECYQDESLVMGLKVLEWAVEAYGPQHSQTALFNFLVGRIYSTMGKHEEATQRFRQSFETNNFLRGLQHYDTLEAWDSYALENVMGQYALLKRQLENLTHDATKSVREIEDYELRQIRRLSLRMCLGAGIHDLAEDIRQGAKRALIRILRGYGMGVGRINNTLIEPLVSLGASRSD